MRLVSLFLLLCVSAWGKPTPEESSFVLETLARLGSAPGTKEALDAETRAGLEKAFETSQAIQSRVTAAYLLTLVSDPSSRYVDFAYDHRESLEPLGKSAVARVLRLHGDAAFERGHFEKAAADFSALRSVAEREQADYATLKLGWCYLNEGKPERAVDLWSRALTKDRKQEQSPPFLAYWKGLGEAVVASKHAEGTTIRELTPSAEALDFLADGIVDGGFARAEGDIDLSAASVKDLAWSETLGCRVLKRSLAAGKAACELLAWADVARPETAAACAPVKETVETCVASVESGKPLEKEPREKLEGLVARLERATKDPGPRLRLLASNHEDAGYCAEGVKWLANPATLSEPDALKLAKACESVDAAQAFGNALGQTIRERPELRRKTWAFLVARLARQPSYATAIAGVIREHEAGFRGTEFPKLVAEQLSRLAKDDEALALWKAFGASDSPEASKSWTAIVLSAVERGLKSDRKRVLAFLERELPPKGNPKSDLSARAWYLYLTSPTTKEESGAFSEEAASWLIAPTNRERFPKFSDAVAESLCQRHAWTALWSALDGTPKLEKGARAIALRCLFDGIASGNVSVPNEGIDDLEARSMAEAAAIASHLDLEKLARWTGEGRGPWVEDFALLQKIDHGALSRSAKDPVRAVQAALRGWREGARRIQRHEWSHPKVLELARACLSDYCRRSRSDLSKWKTYSSDPQWRAALAQVDGQLAGCEKAEAR